MSKADEVARDTLDLSHQYPIHLSSGEAQVTPALLLMSVGNGNVSIVDIAFPLWV
jgi:hypothetical protein